MNYGELKIAIQDYCQNSEDSFLENIPNFVIAAEDKVFLSVQMPAFWKSDSTLKTVNETSEYKWTGIVDIFSVRIGETPVAAAEPVDDGPVRYLLKKDYSFLLEAYPGTTSAVTKGIPKYYAISYAGDVSSNPTLTIRFGPIPDAIYPVTVDYYGKTTTDSITSGDSDSSETWLSVTSPDTLLYGSLIEAYIYMKGEPDLIQTYTSQFQNGLAMLKNMGEGRQMGDAFIDGGKRSQAQ